MKIKAFENKQTGILSVSDLKTFKGKLLYWIMFAVLVIVCLICLVPSIWIILTSFKDTQEIYSEISFFPRDLSLAKIGQRLSTAWKTIDFMRGIINTFVLSAGNLAFSLVICGFGGYALSKIRPRGTKFIFALVVWTLMMPMHVRLVPLFISWMRFPFVMNFAGGVNILNTYWPIWLVAAANSFNVVLFKNYFDSIPKSLVEAGKLDGCSNVGIFFKIMMPLSVPIVMFITIGCLSGAWSDFFTPYLVLKDKDIQTIPVLIYMLKGDGSVKMNNYMMMLVFSSIPPFIIFIVFQRYIIGGITLGGVKG